jgi:7,8-dihydroneopterin aldolase/epimerase/oxygenase
MAKLSVNQFVVHTHLGCSDLERSVPQEVRFSLDITFHTRPEACVSDQLSQTICYVAVCDSIRSAVTPQSFATIEALWDVASKAVATHLWAGTKVLLSVHKVRPPVDGLLGGVNYEDEIVGHG